MRFDTEDVGVGVFFTCVAALDGRELGEVVVGERVDFVAGVAEVGCLWDE